MYGGGGGPAEPVLQLDPCDWTTKNLSEKAEPTAERHPRLNPSKNLAKHVLDPNDRTTSNPYCHSELVSESVPRYEQVSNIDQTLKRSCSTREKRHREKRGFRLVPLLARAVQGDKFLSLRVGFTMAEILLSLTIIGVVAAITLPSLTGNINERTWNTQRKALYARFSQAIALMPSLNAYGTLTEGVDSSGSTVVTEDTAAETFVTNGLAKVLKINNICDNEHLQDCGLPEKFTAMHGSQYDFPTDNQSVNLMLVNAVWEGHTSDNYSHANVKAAAFETINGESIAVFYNPSCTSGMNEESYNVQSKVCMMSIYDLNGTKGPNTVGKDMGFIGALYPSDSVVVAPMPYVQLGEAMPFEDAKSYCKNLSSGEYRLPNLDEAALIFVFKKYLSDYNSGNFWTGISYDADYAWGQGLGGDRGHQSLKTTSKRVWCVQR